MEPRGPARRLHGLGTSIFTEMTRLAMEHGAVNLGQGFPDFPGPDFVKAAANAAIDADLNQYAAAPGRRSLRAAIARHPAAPRPRASTPTPRSPSPAAPPRRSSTR